MLGATTFIAFLGLVAGQSRVLFNCNFETDLCGLTTTGNNIWIRYNQPTPSGNTGPDVAYNGSYYVYFEASDPNYAISAQSPLTLTIPSNVVSAPVVRLRYALHAYGAGITSFNVKLYADNNVLLQNDQVLKAQLQTSSTAPWQVIDKIYSFGSIVRRIEFVVTTFTWEGDLAIDDLTVYAQGCGTCGSNALCSTTNGIEQCVCSSGYAGDGYTCSPNCPSPCDPVKAECIVSSGVASCQCKAGFGSGNGLASSGNSSCVVNILCGAVQCSPYADCVTEFGVPVCRCRSGYVCGDKCVTQGLCANNAVCSVVGGIETCTCGLEYSGDGKSAPGSSGCRSKCELANCGVNAACSLNSAYVAVCQCNTNFVSNGTSCVDVNECLTSGWCRGANTYCLNSIGGFSCECLPNYSANVSTSGRDRSCPNYQQCLIGKTCDCSGVPDLKTVPSISYFYGVNEANRAVALQFLDLWSDKNLKYYCKLSKCNQNMLGDMVANITIYAKRAEEMMNNTILALQRVRDFINCSPYEALEPAWWSLYDTLSDQYLVFKQVRKDLVYKFTLIQEERARCEQTNADWFRKALEWFSPVKF